MNLKEILRQLGAIGIRITPETIWQWANMAVIPGPTGGRRHAVWIEWTGPEAAAAWWFIRKRKMERERVIMARSAVGRVLETGGDVISRLDHLFQVNRERYRLACDWVLAVAKASLRIPFDEYATIIVVREAGKNVFERGPDRIFPETIHPRYGDFLCGAEIKEVEIPGVFS